MNMKVLKKYAINRLKERSTRVVISILLGAAGMAVSPDQIEAIVLALSVLYPAFAAVTPDITESK